MILTSATLFILTSLIILPVPSTCLPTETVPFTSVLDSNVTVTNGNRTLTAGPEEGWQCRKGAAAGYLVTFHDYDRSQPIFRRAAQKFVSTDLSKAFARKRHFDAEWYFNNGGLAFRITNTAPGTTSNGSDSNVATDTFFRRDADNGNVEGRLGFDDILNSISCLGDWVKEWPKTYLRAGMPNTQFTVNFENLGDVAKGYFGREQA